MGQKVLGYGHRKPLQPDPLVLASFILVEIGWSVTLLLGLFPLFLDPPSQKLWCVALCLGGSGALITEFIAIFGRSRFATAMVIAFLLFAGYVTFEGVVQEGLRDWSGRLLLVPAIAILIAIAGQLQWIIQISKWKAAARL